MNKRIKNAKYEKSNFLNVFNIMLTRDELLKLSFSFNDSDIEGEYLLKPFVSQDFRALNMTN